MDKMLISGRSLIKKFTGGALALVLAVSFAVPALGQPAPSGGIGGRTTKVDPNNPRTQSIFIHEVGLGKSASDQVLVANRSDETKTIEIKSVDGVLANDGSYACRENAEEVKGSGTWIKLAKTEVTLPSGGEEKVDFTIQVPENADVGEHNSCITFIDKNAESSAEGGIVLRMRQAIRVSVTVPGDKRRELSIESFAMTDGPEGKAKSGEQHFEMKLKNKGNISADVDMRVRIKNLFGQELANDGGEYVIIPGATLTHRFKTEARPLFGGWYTAEPSIRYDKRLGIYGTQNEGAEYEEQVGQGIRIFLWPTALGWMIIALVVAAVSFCVGWVIFRRKREQEADRYVAKYVVRENDTMEMLSEKSGYSWKVIAKINNLKAPYGLRPGQTLKVPIHKDKVNTMKGRPTSGGK